MFERSAVSDVAVMHEMLAIIRRSEAKWLLRHYFSHQVRAKTIVQMYRVNKLKTCNWIQNPAATPEWIQSLARHWAYSAYMYPKRLVLCSAGFIWALVVLSSCSLLSRSDTASPSDSPSASPTATASTSKSPIASSASPSTTPKVPQLTASASQIDCQDGTAYLMWQANHISGNAKMKIADLQCESGGPKFGQVIETFTLLNGKWVSQGLASGPDISIRTIGECLDGLVSKLTCPAQTLSEDGTQLDGSVLITIDAENTSWEFTANN